MGDTDLYAFRGVAGDSVIVQAVAFLGVRAELYDPDGIRLGANPVALPKTGIYTIRVVESFQRTTSSTTPFSLQCIGVCPAGGDTDADGLPDTWETRFGLDPFDGRTAAARTPTATASPTSQECQAGTHPRGFFTRYLAEGALNAFFDVAPRAAQRRDEPARCPAALPAARRRAGPHFELLPPGPRRTLTRPDLGDALVARLLDRRRIRSADRRRSHDDLGAAATVRTPRRRRRAVDDLVSRRRIDLGRLRAVLSAAEPERDRVDGDRALSAAVRAAADRARRIRWRRTRGRRSPSTIRGPSSPRPMCRRSSRRAQPIIVERAMYMNRPGQPFAAGHGSAGVTAPATQLVPGRGRDRTVLRPVHPAGESERPAGARSRVDYLLLGGDDADEELQRAGQRPLHDLGGRRADSGGIRRQAARQRRGVEHRHLDQRVPIIVERTMWWPSPAMSATSGPRRTTRRARRRRARAGRWPKVKWAGRRAPRPTS